MERLTQLGVHSLKIEGRTKSFYYCARTAQVYRRAIDDAAAGKPFDPTLLTTLEGRRTAATPKASYAATCTKRSRITTTAPLSERQQFVGEFTGVRRDGWAEVDVKNKFSLGDSVEMMTPGGNVVFTLESMQNKKGEPIEVAPGNGHIVYLPIPQDIDLNYALLIRNLAEENSVGA